MGSSKSSPAALRPPPITNRAGSKAAARLAMPRPSHSPTSATSSCAVASPSKAKAVTTEPVMFLGRPLAAASRPAAMGECFLANSRPSRPRAFPEAYCSQQPLFPHSQRCPPGMMIWCPNSPAIPKLPRSTRPSMTRAPPIPVPRVSMTILSRPLPAPKRHSAQAAASASLVTKTGRCNMASRFCRSGSSRHAR